MSARASALAERVAAANQALRDGIVALPADSWRATCSDGEWSNAVAAYHAASSIGTVAAMVRALALGEPVQPITFAALDEANAAMAKAHAECTREEALACIDTDSPTAVSVVRSLTDEQLDRKREMAVGMPEVAVEAVIEMLLVGHPKGHLQTFSSLH